MKSRLACSGITTDEDTELLQCQGLDINIVKSEKKLLLVFLDLLGARFFWFWCFKHELIVNKLFLHLYLLRSFLIIMQE